MEIVHQAELGYNMTLLDIGGGFPGSDDTKLKFEEVLDSPLFSYCKNKHNPM